MRVNISANAETPFWKKKKKKKKKKKHKETKREQNTNVFIKTDTDIFPSVISYANHRGEGGGGCLLWEVDFPFNCDIWKQSKNRKKGNVSASNIQHEYKYAYTEYRILQKTGQIWLQF